MSNFDDAADIRRLRALFQEQMNATSGGRRPTMIPYEDYGYNFPPDQTFNTPPSEITLPPAQVYASGGAVDTMGGYDDYGSGRFTRTPAERRENRERRIEQWAPPSPEDDWGAREWSRFGTIHGYNPLSYGMEALGRLDSAGRDWEGRDYWDNLLDPNPHLYEKTGSLLGATADAASILTMGLPGKAAKIVGMGLPLLYDLGDEAGRALFGHADGGQVFDPEGDEYDYETALAAGLSPDDTEHWPSRDPATGMLLKGRRHPTYDIGVAADRDLGLEEVLAGSGRYYTLPPGLREGGAVSKALRRIRSTFGETQGRRAEQAADLVNLDRFAEKSLVDLFDPANRDGGGLFVAMPTDRFQDYAPQLPQSAVDAIPYPRWKNVPRSAARGIDPLDRSQDTYLDLLGRRIEAKGLDEAPTLWLSRTGDPMTKVVEHEGRHRMMALDRLGDDRALVNLRPANSGEMRGEIDERIARLMEKYFPRGAGTMVIPQDSGLMRAPRAMYEEPFAGGGPVQKAFSFMRKRLDNRDKFLEDTEALVGTKPRVLYHASPGDIHQFEPGRPNTYSTTFGSYGSSNPVTFLAESPELADYFAQDSVGRYKPGASIYPLYLNAKNPVDLREGVQWDVYDALKGTDFNPRSVYDYGPTDMWQAFENANGGTEFMNALKSLGYDSARLTEFHPEGLSNQNSWVSFDPRQIKSIFNRGSYDPEDPRIGYADGGKVLSKLARHVLGKPKQARLPSGETVEALPIREFEDIADTFARKHGNSLPSEYAPFDEDRARRIADAYDVMRHDPLDPQVRRSYEALIDETMDQYRALEGTGARFEFLRPGEADPYAASPALGYLDLLNNGRLKVFPTDSGFGTLTDISDNPLLRRVGRVGDLEDATANDAFRVVHDALGHFGPGNPFFRHQGEERAWDMHRRAYSPEAVPAMTSETRGQNSWVNFGPHGARNRTASGADTVFADQKTGLLPSWVYEDGYAFGGSVDDDFLLYHPQMFDGYADGGPVDDDLYLGYGTMYYRDGGPAPSGYFGSC